MGGEAKVIPRRKVVHKAIKPTRWRKTAMDRGSDQWPQIYGVILGKLPEVMAGNGATGYLPISKAPPQLT